MLKSLLFIFVCHGEEMFEGRLLNLKARVVCIAWQAVHEGAALEYHGS